MERGIKKASRKRQWNICLDLGDSNGNISYDEYLNTGVTFSGVTNQLFPPSRLALWVV